jgi:phenylalanyl-tRNA synthetase beta chain
VGRIYGYDNISPLAPLVTCAPPERNKFRRFEREIKSILSGNHNMIEVSGYSFVGEETLNRLGINRDEELRLRNPLSTEQDRLRRSLLPNIMNDIKLNSRYWDEFAVYELGRVYLKERRSSAELAKEKTMVTGAFYRKKPAVPVFYEITKIAKGLMSRLQVADYSLVPMEQGLPPYAHPVRAMALRVEQATAGFIFELHPEAARAFDISGSAALFDIDAGALFRAKKLESGFTELQKFPEVPFEVSILAGQFEYGRDICAIIEKSNIELIRSVDVVAVYEGAPVPEGKKSVSLKIIFSSKDRTLSPDEIDKLQKDIVSLLGKKGYLLR